MASDATGIDLASVPLFPLPEVVLFPNALLPLHIFEQRYREMTVDALAGDKLIAMALLKQGWEKNYYSRPAIEPVVCVGRIVGHEALADGNHNLLLEGLIRASVVREIEGRSYRMARLRKLDESPAMEIDLDALRAKMEELFRESRFRLTTAGRMFTRIVRSSMGTSDVADLAAFTLLDSAQVKQSLLAEPDVRARVERALLALEVAARCLPPSLIDAGPSDPSVN